MVVFRFSFNWGLCGGIVIAADIKDARKKVMAYLQDTEKCTEDDLYDAMSDKGEDMLIVWEWKQDDYYDEDHPDVMNLYGY